MTKKDQLLNKLFILLCFLWLFIMIYFAITNQYDQLIKNLIILVGNFIFGFIYAFIKSKK